jgi:hypothetical protein
MYENLYLGTQRGEATGRFNRQIGGGPVVGHRSLFGAQAARLAIWRISKIAVAQNPLMGDRFKAKIRTELDRMGRQLWPEHAIEVRHWITPPCESRGFLDRASWEMMYIIQRR